MEKILLSVITPVYQGQRFIESCIKVVINQKYDFLEHLIIDGGSTDGTVEIIRQYASRYPHIRWVSEKDSGQSSAMNKGIRMAKGRFINILNVDDYYEPNALHEAMQILQTLPEPSFLTGNCRNWNTDGTIQSITVPKKLDVASIILGSPFPNNPSAYFYHRSLHDRVGYYDEKDHYSMDLEFILRMLPQVNTKHVNKIWGNYRLIEGTKTMDTIKDGRIWGFIEKHFEHHLQLLPDHQKMYVKAVRAWRKFLERLKYYLARARVYISHPTQAKKFFLKDKH